VEEYGSVRVRPVNHSVLKIQFNLVKKAVDFLRVSSKVGGSSVFIIFIRLYPVHPVKMPLTFSALQAQELTAWGKKV
jgi:hypothetical protein